MRRKTPNRSIVTALLSLVTMLTTLGCGASRSVPMTGELGCATVDELVERYKSGHRRRDMTSLRPLFFWNAQWLTRAVRKEEEAAMMEICSHRLVAVEFKDAPVEQVSYHIPKGPGTETVGGVFAKGTEYENESRTGIEIPKGSRETMIGPVCGKLLVVVDDKTVVDPAFVVLKFQDRYYIDVIKFVLLEAADALKAGRRPKYIADPLNKSQKLLDLD